ncbi:hypothetical protein K9B32_16460 [Rhizobium sp. 3T7]|uniref:hypothetical protein n=1 Tax=Rhizobium sp. 3T7 TaxID=2874922 RepID=UPI001CCBD3BD|nr:hypothetical protein [Rhizobium sp. 3T7]MBZ9791698.1 hypothetical protein [Rhizobium sp. 3T7]
MKIAIAAATMAAILSGATAQASPRSICDDMFAEELRTCDIDFSTEEDVTQCKVDVQAAIKQCVYGRQKNCSNNKKQNCMPQ